MTLTPVANKALGANAEGFVGLTGPARRPAVSRAVTISLNEPVEEHLLGAVAREPGRIDERGRRGARSPAMALITAPQ